MIAVLPHRLYVRRITPLHRYYRSYLVKALLVSSRSARWLLLPAYLAAGAALWGLLQGAQPALWTLGYAACTAAVLVPAKMIEFRCVRHRVAQAGTLHAACLRKAVMRHVKHMATCSAVDLCVAACTRGGGQPDMNIV